MITNLGPFFQTDQVVTWINLPVVFFFSLQIELARGYALNTKSYQIIKKSDKPH